MSRLAVHLLMTLTAAAPAASAGEDVQALIADTIVDPSAWNFIDGRWGTTVNGQTFQQEALVTFNGHQYAAYFADGGVLAVARRRLPGTDWQAIRFADYTARDHRDAHNVNAIGIAGDGTIHLTFDHHAGPLHYRRSIVGLASEPMRFEWTAGHFGPVQGSFDGRNPVRSLTYPHTFAAPGGKLQMLYRVGASGDGDWHLIEYDPAAGDWTTIGLLLSRAGTYHDSTSRCAYPNPLRYDDRGRLHMTWTWREAPKDRPFDLRTNHDLLYAYSDDLGRTWHNNADQVIARLPDGQSISIDTPGIVAHPTKWLWGQMNTTTQFVDRRRRVHVIHWQHDQAAAESSTDLNTWRYYHYWRDADGTWHENLLPFAGRKPQIALDPAGNAYVVYLRTDNANYHHTDPGGRLTIAVAEEASKWTQWRTVWSSERMSVGEPLLDVGRWQSEGVLSVYVQDKPDRPGAPSALRVMDFAFSEAADPQVRSSDVRNHGAAEARSRSSASFVVAP